MFVYSLFREKSIVESTKINVGIVIILSAQIKPRVSNVVLPVVGFVLNLKRYEPRNSVHADDPIVWLVRSLINHKFLPNAKHVCKLNNNKEKCSWEVWDYTFPYFDSDVKFTKSNYDSELMRLM